MATGLLDYLEAAGETGATLGSGAAATLAGIPYGILQNIRSGKYGTKEGVKLADKAKFLAKSKDAMAGPTTFPAQGAWTRARMGRNSGSRDGGNRSGNLIG